MFLCLPAILFDIYLSLYFMTLFTYMLFILNGSKRTETALNQAKQQSLILIFLLPLAVFNISPADCETALLKGSSSINCMIALTLSAISLQIYNNIVLHYKGQKGDSKNSENSFNKFKLFASFSTGFIEELFLRITLFHIVGYDLVVFTVISITSSTIYCLIRVDGAINTSTVVINLILNTIYTLALVFTGWMSAPIALKFLTNIGENLHRIKIEFNKGCSFIKVRLSCCAS